MSSSYGVDITDHSATKFIGGHGDILLAVWLLILETLIGEKSGKFPQFVEPDPSYHDIKLYT